MFKDLLEYNELFEACPEYFSFGTGVFLRDFGPWKKGEEVSEISFNIEENATAQQHDDNGNIIKQCKFQLVALPD